MKTRDGIKLSNILRIAEDLGVTIRAGTNHPYILNYENMRPCPLAESTDAKRMLIPWISNALGYDKSRLYSAMKKGDTEYL